MRCQRLPLRHSCSAGKKEGKNEGCKLGYALAANSYQVGSVVYNPCSPRCDHRFRGPKPQLLSRAVGFFGSGRRPGYPFRLIAQPTSDRPVTYASPPFRPPASFRLQAWIRLVNARSRCAFRNGKSLPDLLRQAPWIAPEPAPRTVIPVTAQRDLLSQIIRAMLILQSRGFERGGGTCFRFDWSS